MPASTPSKSNPEIQMSMWIDKFLLLCQRLHQKLDASASNVAAHLFCRLKTRLDTIADRAPRQVISRQAEARQAALGIANFPHPLGVTHIVLRKRTGIFPYGAVDGGTGDPQNCGI